MIFFFPFYSVSVFTVRESRKTDRDKFLEVVNRHPVHSVPNSGERNDGARLERRRRTDQQRNIKRNWWASRLKSEMVVSHFNGDSLVSSRFEEQLAGWKSVGVPATEAETRPLLVFITADRIRSRFYRPAGNFHRVNCNYIPAALWAGTFSREPFLLVEMTNVSFLPHRKRNSERYALGAFQNLGKRRKHLEKSLQERTLLNTWIEFYTNFFRTSYSRRKVQHLKYCFIYGRQNLRVYFSNVVAWF